MRYRLYFKNPVWNNEGDCWDDQPYGPDTCCPQDDGSEDRVLIKRVPEETYYLSLLPEEFRGTISYMAYERGHAYGEDEVRNILIGLVGDLEPCFKTFCERHKIKL